MFGSGIGNESVTDHLSELVVNYSANCCDDTRNTPLTHWELQTAICTCVFSRNPEPGYRGSPSVKTSFTVSIAGSSSASRIRCNRRRTAQSRFRFNWSLLFVGNGNLAAKVTLTRLSCAMRTQSRPLDVVKSRQRPRSIIAPMTNGFELWCLFGWPSLRRIQVRVLGWLPRNICPAPASHSRCRLA